MLDGDVNMKFHLILCGILLTLACRHQTPIEPDQPASLPQWPMFRHGVRHTGNVNNDPYEGIVGPRGPNVSVKWSFDSGALIYGSPAIDKDGTIYFGTTRFGADSVFYAVNLDGTLKWKFDDFGRGGTWSSPVIADDGTIYCISRIGTFAFNRDGSLKWKLDRGSEGPGGIALGPDGTLYWCDFQFLNAVTPNGVIKWQLNGGNDFHHSVAGLDGTIYYHHYDRRTLIAVYPDGTIKWEYADTISFIFDSAVIDGNGSIYFLSSAGTLYSVDNAGHLKWKIPNLGTINGIDSPAIAPNGTIVVVGYDSLYTISPDGRQLWRSLIYFATSPPVIDAEGNIYITHRGGPIQRSITCYSIDGILKWQVTEFPTLTIISGTPLGPDGALFFGSQNNPYLFALH
jgi:outer membrane protein assembly factor BamB